MSKLNVFIISLTVVSVALFGSLLSKNNSSYNPVPFASANLDIGSTAPTFTPTPTGIGSSAPTYTPTPTFTLTPTSTSTPTPSDTPTMTPTPTNTPTETPTDTPTMTPTPTATPTPTPTPYILVKDNGDAGFSTIGKWKVNSSGTGFIGTNWLHDQNNQKGQKSARWTTILPAGTYKVYVWYVGTSSNASNVPYAVNYLFGTNIITVDQRLNQSSWVLLGTFIFDGLPHYVEVRNTGTNGYVTADAVRFEQVF